jgi:phosphoglycerol geranylgeranyltransferase
MESNIYEGLLEAKKNRQKKFTVLIDPDRISPEGLIRLLDISVHAGVDYFFIGGSLLVNDTISECIDVIKSCSDIPVILFPGSNMQIHQKADAILFLSLISGRNPELLIGQHVIAAPAIKASRLEVVSTGYILIDGGTTTTVSYISNTTPIPHHKDEIALCTAIAGEMLGLKTIYLDAGSGAHHPVDISMVELVSENCSVPLIAGGGIKTADKAASLCRAGADMIVVGTAIEKDSSLIHSISRAIHSSIII